MTQPMATMMLGVRESPTARRRPAPMFMTSEKTIAPK